MRDENLTEIKELAFEATNFYSSKKEFVGGKGKRVKSVLNCFSSKLPRVRSASPSNHVLLCENELGIGHVNGQMKGFYMEMKGYE